MNNDTPGIQVTASAENVDVSGNYIISSNEVTDQALEDLTEAFGKDDRDAMVDALERIVYYPTRATRCLVTLMKVIRGW